MYAGHYNNKTCHGDDAEHYKFIDESSEQFIESAENNYDIAVTNAKTHRTNRIVTTREVEAKKFLLHAKMQRCLILKEIYKKYHVDLQSDEEAFAYLFFLMAIKENERRKIAAKRHIYYLEQKAKRALYKIQCIKELTVDDFADSNEFNLNNTSFSSAIPNDRIYTIKRSVSTTDKEFNQFEQVFAGSVFYMHKTTKKLWLMKDNTLVPLQSTDYIRGE